MSQMLDGVEYVECACHSGNHVLRFIKDFDPVAPCIYVEVQLNPWLRLWPRIVLAVKYVFGYAAKYGHWDCTQIEADQADKLIAMCQQLKEASE